MKAFPKVAWDGKSARRGGELDYLLGCRVVVPSFGVEGDEVVYIAAGEMGRESALWAKLGSLGIS